MYIILSLLLLLFPDGHPSVGHEQEVLGDGEDAPDGETEEHTDVAADLGVTSVFIISCWKKMAKSCQIFGNF